ncbi:MAG: conjugal transfer protein TraN [Desulfurococcaceae archaeon]
MNGNQILDDCRELPACVYMNNQYVCPLDVRDPVCSGSCVYSGAYGDIKYYDTNPRDFDSVFYTYAKSRGFLSWQQYQNTCGWQAPSLDHRQNIWNLYGTEPVWIQGGILYSDAWFSFQSCGQYVDFLGRCWIQENADCRNFPYRWQRLESRCYPTGLSSSFYVSHYVCSLNGRRYGDYNSCSRDCRSGYCYQTWTYLTTFWWNGNLNSTQYNYAYDSWTGRSYTVSLSCASWTTIDAFFGCGSSAYRGRIQVCTTYLETVSGSVRETRYWYADLNRCSSPSGWQSGGQTASSFSVSSSGTYNYPAETRVIPQNNKGVLFVPEVRCRPCSTSLAGFPGQKELVINDPSRGDDFDRLAQCVNPRFFSGEVRRCRPGGITVLGASCCGISGWTKNMCNKTEKELKKRREAGTCTYVGDYCSRRILGFCVERRRSFCCFNSSLARIFQECGRPQINRPFGNPRNPDCRGFTPEEFQLVDFSDDRCQALFEEYVNKMIERLDLNAKAEEALSRVQGWINSQMQDFVNYGREPKRGY